jgi:hypothetical protein
MPVKQLVRRQKGLDIGVASREREGENGEEDIVKNLTCKQIKTFGWVQVVRWFYRRWRKGRKGYPRALAYGEAQQNYSFSEMSKSFKGGEASV